jgi:multidrug efflux pump subunit AcrB
VVNLLQSHEEVASAALFIGGSAPRFYYNVTPKAPAANIAQVLINARRAEDTPALVAKLRDELDRTITGARCVVKQLEQGPPVDTPIQVRLTGDDLDTLRARADQVADALKRAGGYHVHDDLGHRSPTLNLQVDQDRATAFGVIPPGDHRRGPIGIRGDQGHGITRCRAPHPGRALSSLAKNATRSMN